MPGTPFVATRWPCCTQRTSRLVGAMGLGPVSAPVSSTCTPSAWTLKMTVPMPFTSSSTPTSEGKIAYPRARLEVIVDAAGGRRPWAEVPPRGVVVFELPVLSSQPVPKPLDALPRERRLRHPGTAVAENVVADALLDGS